MSCWGKYVFPREQRQQRPSSAEIAPLIIPCIYQYLCQDLRDFALWVKVRVDGVDRVLNSPLRSAVEEKCPRVYKGNEKKIFLWMKMYIAQKNTSKASERKNE